MGERKGNRERGRRGRILICREVFRKCKKVLEQT